MFEYYIKRVQGRLGRLSESQMKGAFGEIAAVFQLKGKLRQVFPHPFPNPKVEYTPNFSSNQPDINVRVGSISLPIEVKHWQFDGPITSAHVHEVSQKTDVRLFLSIYPKQLTDAAKRALKHLGICLVNGLSHLLEAISQLCIDTQIATPTSCVVEGGSSLGDFVSGTLLTLSLSVSKGGGVVSDH